MVSDDSANFIYGTSHRFYRPSSVKTWAQLSRVRGLFDCQLAKKTANYCGRAAEMALTFSNRAAGLKTVRTEINCACLDRKLEAGERFIMQVVQQAASGAALRSPMVGSLYTAAADELQAKHTRIYFSPSSSPSNLR